MATKAQQQTFINLIAPLIQAECKKRGWGVPSAIIAQACIESAWGLSGLAKYHNYFGLKCGSSWKGASVNMKTKEEYTVGVLTTISDNFRAYSDMAAGVAGYFDFVSANRYSAARTARDPRTYLTAIKNAGYATSSTYVNTNMSTINAHQLTKYDDLTFSSNSTVQSDPVITAEDGNYTIGNVYTTIVNLNVRSVPVTGSVLKTYKSGTRFTCKEIRNVQGVIWLRTPSGWICTGAGGKKYVK